MIHQDTTPAMAVKWAEFSGDFNPIHFDVTQAGKAGSDRLIVHGMLALLHVKQATLKALHDTASPAGWSRFKALFRRPIPQSSPLQLSIREKNAAVRFSLEGDGCEYSRGLHEPTSAPLLQPLAGAPECLLDGPFVRAQFELFRASFRSVSEAWIFLDALVFGKFLQQRFADLADMHADTVAVQVSHCVECNTSQVQALFGQADRLPQVGYSVRKVNESAQAESASGIAQLDVFADGELVMQIEIGLLAKNGASA